MPYRVDNDMLPLKVDRLNNKNLLPERGAFLCLINKTNINEVKMRNKTLTENNV